MSAVDEIIDSIFGSGEDSGLEENAVELVALVKLTDPYFGDMAETQATIEEALRNSFDNVSTVDLWRAEEEEPSTDQGIINLREGDLYEYDPTTGILHRMGGSD